jgi:hypothetical protein
MADSFHSFASEFLLGAGRRENPAAIFFSYIIIIQDVCHPEGHDLANLNQQKI